jgi:hypothetical protein
MTRAYRYVGPDDIRAATAGSPAGTPIRSRADLAAWLAAHAAEREGATVPATFVVGTDRTLRIAPRRSEHVACAAGGEVLAAGELFLDERGVAEASNQSTGYCPEPSCWTALAAALDAAGIVRPRSLTHAFVFRRCACGQRNIVKDGDFTCGVCGADLPAAWNF